MPDPKLGKLYDVFQSQTPELVQGMEKDAFITKFSNEEKLVKLYNELGKSPKTQPYLVGLDQASFVSKFKPEKDLGIVDKITGIGVSFTGKTGIGGAPIPNPEQDKKQKAAEDQAKVVEHHTALQEASTIIDDPKSDLVSKQEAFFKYSAEADKTYNKAKDYLVDNKNFDEKKYYNTIEKVSAFSSAMKQAKTTEEHDALKAQIEGDVAYLKELQTIPEFNAWTDAYKSLRTLEGKKKKLLPELVNHEEYAKKVQKRTDNIAKDTDIGSDVQTANEIVFSNLAGAAGKIWDTVKSISDTSLSLWDPKQAQENRVGSLIEREKRTDFLQSYIPTDIKGQYKETYVELLNGNKVILDDAKTPVYGRDSKGFMVPLSKEDREEAFHLASDENKIQDRRNFKALGGVVIPVLADLAVQIALTKGMGGIGVTNSTMGVLIPTAIQSMGPYYYEALKDGKSDKEAFALSSAKAVLDGLLENIGGLENKLAGKGVTDGLIKAAKGDVRARFLAGQLDSKHLLGEYLNYIKARVSEAIKEGIGETVEEFAQGIEQGIVDNIGGADQNIIDTTLKSAEETALISFGVGAGTSIMANLYRSKKDFSKSILISAIDQMRANRPMAEQMIADAAITDEKKSMLINQLDYIDNELSDKTFKNDNARLDATHLAKVKMELEVNLEAAKEKGADKEVKRINEVLKDVKEKLDTYNTPEVVIETPTPEAATEAPSGPSPSPEALGDITDDEYKDFVDNNNVSEDRLTSIAEKVKRGTETLTDKEQAILASKGKEIEDILATIKQNETVLGNLFDGNQVGHSDPNFIEVTQLVDAIGTDSLFENDKGERGTIDIDTDGSVVLTTDKGETVLGNTKELGDATVEQLGLKQVTLQDNNNTTYSIGDSTYTIDNPKEAVEYDDNGRVKAVTVTEFKEGKVQGKTITGPEAQELAYKIKLKELYERDGQTVGNQKIAEYTGSQSNVGGDATVGEDSNAGSNTKQDLPGTSYKSNEGVIYTIDSYTAKGHIKFQYQDRNGKTVKGVWDKNDFNAYVKEGSLTKTTETAAPVATTATTSRKTNPFSTPAPTVKPQVTNNTLNTVKKEAPEKVAKLGRLALKKGDKVTVRDANGKVVKRNVTVLEVSQDKRSVRTELGGKFASVPIDQVDHLDTKNIVAAVKKARIENSNPKLVEEADALVSGEPTVKLPEPPGSNITYKEYDTFKATGEIKESHLKSIASKVLANKELSRIEKEIYKGKKQEVDTLVSDIKTKREEAKQAPKEKKLSEIKQLEQEADSLITKAVKDSRPERAKLLAEGKTEEQADTILQDNWLKTPEGQQYTALEAKIQELKAAEVKPVKEKTKEQLALEENQRQYEAQKNLPEAPKAPTVEVNPPAFVDQSVPVVEPEAAAEAKKAETETKKSLKEIPRESISFFVSGGSGVGHQSFPSNKSTSDYDIRSTLVKLDGFRYVEHSDGNISFHIPYNGLDVRGGSHLGIAIKGLKLEQIDSKSIKQTIDKLGDALSKIPKNIIGDERQTEIERIGNEVIDAELKALEEQQSTSTAQTATAQSGVEAKITSKQEGFKNAGEQSKKENNSNAIADYLLQNAKVGDTLTDKNGEGYEIIEVNNRKDGSKEVVLVPFELIDGKIDYSYSGTKLISEKNKKTASDLYEFSYTNSNGERINETYTYNAKAEIQSLENNTTNDTQEVVSTDIEAKTKKDKVKVEAEARRIKEADGLKLTTNMLKQLAVAIKEGKIFPTVNKKVTGDNTNVDKGDVIKTKEGIVGVIIDMTIERGNRTLHVRSSAGHVFTINTGLPVSGKGSSYEVIDVKDFEYRDPTFFDIEYQISAALAALRNIIPTINIQLLSNEEYTAKFGQNERGKFERKAGVSTIYINKDTANEYTVFHEAAHAVLTHFFGVNDPRIFTFHQAIKEAISTSKDIDIQNLINKLDAHIALYKNDPTGVIPHEYLAELVGILAHNKETLAKPGLVDRMVDFVNDALEKLIGIRPLRSGSDINNIINIINNISANLATGKTIATDLEVLGTGDIELDYKQLIGPEGASNLDKEENTKRRMDALLAAIKFKDAAKTPKIIDMSTGWIYTKTGWKYSIANFDNKIRLEPQSLNILKELTNAGYTVKLTDVIGAGEVFRAYPQLKDLNISVGVIAPNTLALSQEDIKDKNAAKTAIVYGLQRAIQRIEGIEDVDEAKMVAEQPDLVFSQKIDPNNTEDISFASKFAFSKEEILTSIGNSYASGKLSGTANSLYKLKEAQFKAKEITEDDIAIAIGEKPISKTFVERVAEEAPYVPEENIMVEEELKESEREAEYTTFISKILKNPKLPWPIKALLEEGASERVRLTRDQLKEISDIFIEQANTLPEIRKALVKVRRSLGYFSSIPKNSELAGRINGWQFIAMNELSDRAYLLGDNNLSSQIKNDIGDLAANMGRAIFTLAAMEDKSVASTVLISKLRKDYDKVDPITGTSALDDMSAYIQSILPNDEETKNYLSAIEKKINNLLFNIEDVSFSSKTTDPKEQFINQLLKKSTTRTTEATILSKALSAHRRRLTRLEKESEVKPIKEKVDPIVKLAEDIKANRITIAELAKVKSDVEAELVKYPEGKRAEILNKIEDLMADITGHNIGTSSLRKAIKNNADQLKKTLLQIAGDRVRSTTFKDTLLNQIKRETGLSDEEAKKYEKLISSTFKEMLEKDMAAKESVAKSKILNAKVEKAKENVEKNKAALEAYNKDTTGPLAARLEGARILKEALAQSIKTYQKALAQKEHFLQRAKEPFSVLNSIRVGSINTLEVANEFKDFYELSGITQTDLDKLNALSKELENATREADKLEAYKDFTLLLEDIVNSKSSKYWTSDSFYEYAYVGMLSSPLTVARAFGSAFKLFIESNFTSDALLALGKTAATMNPIHLKIYAKGVADGAIGFKNALPAAWQAMIKGIATEGVDPSEAGRLLGKGKLLSWRATQSFFKLFNNPKDLKASDTFFIPFYAAVFLGRGLIAMDILTKSFFHPYMENRLASYEVLKYTTEESAVNFAKEVDALRGYTDALEAEVEEDVKTHPEALALSGTKLEKWKKHRRHVLAKEFTDKTIREASNDIAGELAMTGAVHGTIGALINPLIARRQQHNEGAWARHLSFMALPFARVAGIGTNIITSALPTNLLQTKLNDKQQWTGGFQLRKTKRTYTDSKKLEKERDLLTYELVNMTFKALAPSITFLAAIMYMFDFEKEKDEETGEEYHVVKLADSNLRITGGDNSSRIKNRTTKGDGWEPFSIQWLDRETNKWHTKYMYLDGLFGALLSPLGTLSDKMRNDPDFGQKTTKSEAIGDLLTGLQSYVLNFGWGSGFTTITNMIDIISATVDGKDKDITYDNLISTTVRPAVPMLGLASFFNKFGEYYLDKDKIDRSGANAATDAVRSLPLIGRTVKGLTSAFSVIPGLNNIDYLYPYVDVDPIGYPAVDRLNVGILPAGFQEAINNEPESKVPRVWKVLRKYPESFGYHHFYVNDRVKDFEEVLSSPSLTFKAQVKQKAAEVKRQVLEAIVPSLESYTEGPYDPNKAKSLLKINTSINDDVNDHVLVAHLLEVIPKLRSEASNFTKKSDLNLLGGGRSYEWDKLSKYLLANSLVIENDELKSRAGSRSSVPLKDQEKSNRKVKSIIRKGK